MKRIFRIACILITLTACLTLSASAAPTDSFRRQYEQGGVFNSVRAREVYDFSQNITAASLGLDTALDGLSDICAGPDGCVYILCGDESRIIVLEEDYSLKSELEVLDEDGNKLYFSGASGIFVYKTGDIYIADTNNKQILVLSQEGVLIDTWGEPESSSIPGDFYYQPTAIEIDADGYAYILSNGCFYGALSYSPEGEFLGFYGSNTVKATALDTLSFLWDKLTGTDEKRAASIKILPYSFVDLCLDSDNYMITCTGIINARSNSTGNIRKIGPNGANILYRKGIEGGTSTSDSFIFLESRTVYRNGFHRVQNIISIDVDENGFMFALDATYGLIYVYDTECNLLTGFGGGMKTGIQQGIFNTPVALAVHGSSVLVADKENNSVSVFKLTPYGGILFEANKMHIRGDYEEAAPLWEQILISDRGNQLASRGLAMASYIDGDYKTALDYAEDGVDYTVYDLAWQRILTGFVAENFLIFFTAALLLIGGLIAFLVIIKKRQTVLVKNPKLKILCNVPFHPFRSYEELKYKKMGSPLIATVLLLFFYIASALKATVSGFLFTYSSPKSHNTLFTLAQTAGLVLLWTLSNWLVCSLMSGKGKFGEIYTATSYALLPLIIFTFLQVAVSNFLPLSGAGLLSGLSTAVMIFTLFLICIAMMTVHEYDFFKFAATSAITLFLMVLIVFILLMLGSLLQQLGDFFYSIYSEIVYR